MPAAGSREDRERAAGARKKQKAARAQVLRAGGFSAWVKQAYGWLTVLPVLSSIVSPVRASEIFSETPRVSGVPSFARPPV